MLHDLAGGLDALDNGGAHGDLFAVSDQQHVERDLGANLGVQLLHGDDVAHSGLILLTTGLNDCVHCCASSFFPDSLETVTGVLNART